MKKGILMLAALAAISSASALAEVHQYAVRVGDFTKIKVLGAVDVVYKCNADSVGYAGFECDSHLADALIFSNSNGTLKVEVKADVRPESLPTVCVYSRFLGEVENESTGTLTVYSPAPAPIFKATVVGNGRVVASGLNFTEVGASLKTGNGSIVLSGECTTARLSLLGTGLIQADELKAENVSCRIWGSGQIGCWPVESLESKGVGSTKIYYKGNPPRVRKSGGGKIMKLDSADVEMLGGGIESKKSISK